ncbi:MAG: hypothetical protein IKG98_08680 [Ruminococcus sp.]|nr:hypothetical protein [Ruminococcus sp.]
MMITEKSGLDETESTELKEYIANRFSGAKVPEGGDVDFLRGWRGLASLAEDIGAAEVINQKLCPKLPVSFNAPEGVRLEIFASFAGGIPIIYADDPSDFESLVTNIVYKGTRPANIEKTGASFVSGRTARFIILSAKPYSNVPAEELGLSTEAWAEKSMLIRRSHECTHFYTKQTYGISNNILHDELMADFIGLYDSFGFYKAEWFLRFMGIISGSGSRLAVYTADLSPRVSAAVAELAEQAAYGLEKWSHSEGFKELTNAQRIDRMCRAGIAGMTTL